jgi:hypothetical protein
LRVPEQYFEDLWDQAGSFRDTAQLFVVEIGTFDRHTGARKESATAGHLELDAFVVADNVPLPRWRPSQPSPS